MILQFGDEWQGDTSRSVDGYGIAADSAFAEAMLSVINKSGEFGNMTALEFAEQVEHSVVPGGAILAREALTGTAVACASACDLTLFRPNAGLMYVATLPEHRGRGLGLSVVREAIRAANAAGFPGVALLTDDHRLPAIKLYLKLGFAPETGGDRALEARWRAVLDALSVQDEQIGKSGLRPPDGPRT